MAEKKDNKTTTSVKISKEALAKLDGIHNRLGVGKIELVTRLADWFCAQDKTLQSVILGQLDPQDEASVIDLIKARVLSNRAKSAVIRPQSRTGGHRGSGATSSQSAG